MPGVSIVPNVSFVPNVSVVLGEKVLPPIDKRPINPLVGADTPSRVEGFAMERCDLSV